MIRIFSWMLLGLLFGATRSDQLSAKEPAPPLPVGKWTIEFTNGVKETCDIFEGGKTFVSEPLRSSRGTARAQGGSFVLSFRDDRVERWTAIGNRFVVEHWYPAAQFPLGKPVLGFAENAR